MKYELDADQIRLEREESGEGMMTIRGRMMRDLLLEEAHAASNFDELKLVVCELVRLTKGSDYVPSW